MKKKINPWESDEGSGVSSWAQEVPWSDDGSRSKSSSTEEQFEALDKERLMEKYRKDMGNGGVDVLAVMDVKQAEDTLMKFQENLTGVSED